MKMSDIVIGVVSHGHGQLIEKLGCLRDLAHAGYSVAVLDNLMETGLQRYCKDSQICYLSNKRPKGFASNNNLLFKYFDKEGLLPSDASFFLALNPDVKVEPATLGALLDMAKKNGDHLVAINLFKDVNLTEFDNSIRRFPGWFDFFSSFVFKRNPTVLPKEVITSNTEVDWAAASFLLIKSELYRKLNGFDDGYFMYCEDLDLCWRARKDFGVKTMYYPKIKAIHAAQHQNRQMFSRHFLWHFKSVVRFSLKRWFNF